MSFTKTNLLDHGRRQKKRGWMDGIPFDAAQLEAQMQNLTSSHPADFLAHGLRVKLFPCRSLDTGPATDHLLRERWLREHALWIPGARHFSNTPGDVAVLIWYREFRSLDLLSSAFHHPQNLPVLRLAACRRVVAWLYNEAKLTILDLDAPLPASLTRCAQLINAGEGAADVQILGTTISKNRHFRFLRRLIVKHSEQIKSYLDTTRNAYFHEAQDILSILAEVILSVLAEVELQPPLSIPKEKCVARTDSDAKKTGTGYGATITKPKTKVPAMKMSPSSLPQCNTVVSINTKKVAGTGSGSTITKTKPNGSINKAKTKSRPKVPAKKTTASSLPKPKTVTSVNTKKVAGIGSGATITKTNPFGSTTKAKTKLKPKVSDKKTTSSSPHKPKPVMAFHTKTTPKGSDKMSTPKTVGTNSEGSSYDQGDHRNRDRVRKRDDHDDSDDRDRVRTRDVHDASDDRYGRDHDRDRDREGKRDRRDRDRHHADKHADRDDRDDRDDRE
jgi:hypothetical protein